MAIDVLCYKHPLLAARRRAVSVALIATLLLQSTVYLGYRFDHFERKQFTRFYKAAALDVNPARRAARDRVIYAHVCLARHCVARKDLALTMRRRDHVTHPNGLHWAH